MTDDRPTLYVRLLASGITFGGQVRRIGQVLAIEPGEDGYAYFDRTEQEQRAKWSSSRWEHITAEQYQALLGAPAMAPEKAMPTATKQAPPPPEDGAQRDPGGRGGVSAPSHTPPSSAEPPPPGLDSDPRWPWYEDADVATTLGHVANMSETDAQEFLGWEQSHKARKGVLGPMTGS